MHSCRRATHAAEEAYLEDRAGDGGEVPKAEFPPDRFKKRGIVDWPPVAGSDKPASAKRQEKAPAKPASAKRQEKAPAKPASAKRQVKAPAKPASAKRQAKA